jgi:hypothetical protein
MKNNNYNPANLIGYFTKAIEVQRHAFKPEFATYKLNQSCETLVRCGFCGKHRECFKCALQCVHNDTIKALKDPSEVQRRYEAYVKRMNEHNAHTNYGAKRSVSSKGHVTEVMYCGK